MATQLMRKKIMNYKINGYEPEKLFQFFEEICAIPRGSKNEKAISDYLVQFAKDRDLWYYQDELYNVIIKKEGSEGAKDLPPVMLQGHTDMVCEKLSDVEHDFTKEGLNLMVEDGIVTADGTTLGADNGVAVALMMMVLDDDTLVHPPLECVFTTQEEIGLFGAKELDKSFIQARTMINMDSEEEGIATVSCAGGMRIRCARKIEREPISGTMLRIIIGNLLGGHSGSDIDLGRQNANLLMARLIYHLFQKTPGRLAKFNGGSKDNAIPRECEALLVYEDVSEAQKAEKEAVDLAEKFAEEIYDCEPNFSCDIFMEDGNVEVMTREDADALIHTIYLAPDGVQKRNMKMNGFVVTSCNMGVAVTKKDYVMLTFAPRSSVASLMEDMKERIELLAKTFGFTCDFSGEYPGWSYAEESEIRKVFQESYQRLFGKELKVEAIHAGLECGLFSDALPGMDAIAVGPDIYACHTPDEYLPLDSFERFYKLLKEVLSTLVRE